MAIDRSKFKSTSASQMVQADKQLNKQLGKKEKQTNGHDLAEGANLLRFYPVHPHISEKDPKAQFLEPFVQTFLPGYVWEKDTSGAWVWEDAAKTIHKQKLTVKPVYNSKIHGGTAKDLVEEYIALAGRYIRTKTDVDSEIKTYLEPVYGNFMKKINGITYPSKWVGYADLYPNANPDATPLLDKIFVGKAIKERLNKISAMESKNDPLGTDPFTDVEEGRAVGIFVDKDGGAQGYYTTELDSNTTTEVLKNGRTAKVPKQYPLTDEQLEIFLKEKSLKELYGNCAKRKNFETQLAGLELFDTKNNMGIFGLEEWNAIVLECDGFYPEEDTTTDAGTQDEGEQQDNHDVNETDDSSDEFTLMNRKELQDYCRTEKTGILVKPTMSDEDIRNKLREWLVGAGAPIEHKPLPGEEGYVEEPVIETPVVEKETAESKQEFLDDLNGVKKEVVKEEVKPVLSAAEKLKAMRAKMAGK